MRLRLVDGSGTALVDRELTATAKHADANDARCGRNRLLSLAVGGDGSAVQR